jgi:hypothetical protein
LLGKNKIIGSAAKRAMRAGKKEGGLGKGIFARPPFLGGGCASPLATHKSVRAFLKKGSRFV